MTQSTSSKILNVPITLAYGEGAYSAPVYLGSEKRLANVVLDTGSSAFAVRESVMQPDSDTMLSATADVQVIAYGAGGWAGSVVNTDVTIGHAPDAIDLPTVPVAMITDEPMHNFYQADGIWGLAYGILDYVYDATDLLTGKGIDPAVTYPWPEAVVAKNASLDDIKSAFSCCPHSHIAPYFTVMEEQHQVANIFSLLTRRAIYHHTGSEPTSAQDEQDPLNQGLLILGGGEERTDLYEAPLQSIKLVHDKYYNTHLKLVQVGKAQPHDVPPLDEDNKAAYASNSIFDSGSSPLILEHGTYQYVINSLTAINADFADLISEGQTLLAKGQGIEMSKLNLDEWPPLHLTLEGINGDVTLSIAPKHYWQMNAPVEGQAACLLMGQLEGWAKQSILGLPLLNDKFVIFDRRDDCLKVAMARS